MNKIEIIFGKEENGTPIFTSTSWNKIFSCCTLMANASKQTAHSQRLIEWNADVFFILSNFYFFILYLLWLLKYQNILFGFTSNNQSHIKKKKTLQNMSFIGLGSKVPLKYSTVKIVWNQKEKRTEWMCTLAWTASTRPLHSLISARLKGNVREHVVLIAIINDHRWWRVRVCAHLLTAKAFVCVLAMAAFDLNRLENDFFYQKFLQTWFKGAVSGGA